MYLSNAGKTNGAPEVSGGLDVDFVKKKKDKRVKTTTPSLAILT